MPDKPEQLVRMCENCGRDFIVDSDSEDPAYSFCPSCRPDYYLTEEWN